MPRIRRGELDAPLRERERIAERLSMLATFEEIASWRRESPFKAVRAAVNGSVSKIARST
jgi:hypothetical protein